MIVRKTKLYAVVLLLLGTGVAPLHLYAQDGLSAVVRNTLAIGNLTVGRILNILPESPSAAKFEVRSSTEQYAIIQLILPTRLQEIGGSSQVSVTFNADCARWSFTDNVENSTSFDPRLPLSVKMKINQPVIIWVGAFVAPASIVQAGRYTASITLTATPVTR